MSSQQKKSAAGARFELLPALKLDFGSITDGTDIPPPPESPIEPTYTPSKTSDGSNASIGAKEPTSSTHENKAGPRSLADNAPPSPAASGHQDSIIQESARSVANVYRPASRGAASAASAADSEKTKRASGWFKRLRSGDTQSRRRSSLLSLEQTNVPTASKSTPAKPPPKIPNLVHLESESSSFGSDLFDHIK
ncbi:hypothetical protein BBK36DRAFT_1190257 [Trichoderma citrinoviride]|uniref:Uncharacterized protein n=1 Tax=Trichoderma citrinoviride TaxID=58853 RepID=A0A2T4AXF8_9HYPO|nr:hypothetical protein BBK36DRAFT_1190257 [Trichoderma citrinoviride]PTB61765.1 hypothetical protein BBK36DRAFT_1190257 [Trichoderma citrinoviride]